MAVDPRNFLLNTNYPMDKIIYMKSGSFSATGGGGIGTTVDIAHNLSYTPLLIGTWSTSSTFSPSYEGGWFNLEGTDPAKVYCTFYSNSTNARIICFNPGSTTTIYYRIYGYMPSNVNESTAKTASLADNFIINTSYNYTKLLTSGYEPATASKTINHNLGYRPQVIAWYYDGSYTSSIVTNGDSKVKVTTTTIEIISPYAGVHYRIYADGQL